MEWAAGGVPTNQQTEPEEETQGGAYNLPGEFSLPHTQTILITGHCYIPSFLVPSCLTDSLASVQEPGPAKVAVTGSGIPEAEKVPDSSSIIWQEELNQREAEGAAVWAAADLPPGSPAGKEE